VTRAILRDVVSRVRYGFSAQLRNQGSNRNHLDAPMGRERSRTLRACDTAGSSKSRFFHLGVSVGFGGGVSAYRKSRYRKSMCWTYSMSMYPRRMGRARRVGHAPALRLRSLSPANPEERHPRRRWLRRASGKSGQLQ
jgi:hypothetical protein